jgi:hypothetical protein
MSFRYVLLLIVSAISLLLASGRLGEAQQQWASEPAGNAPCENSCIWASGVGAVDCIPCSTSGFGPPRAQETQTDQSYEELLDQPMQFAIVRNIAMACEPLCAEWISASGRITPDTPAQLRKILKSLDKRRLPIVIQSNGGNLDAALSMGKAIRANKLDVIVGATIYEGCNPDQKDCKPTFADGSYAGTTDFHGVQCFSACTYVLAAGNNRVASILSWIGVHQITITTDIDTVVYETKYRMVNGKKKAVSRRVVSRTPNGTVVTTKISKGLRKKLVAYYNEMGVDPAILDKMLAVPAKDMAILTYKELVQFKLITDMADKGTLTDGDVCTRDPRPDNCVELKTNAKI